MSTDIVARVPYKHAEVIKAWADGEQIEYRPDGQQHWTLCGHAFKPSWAEEYEYRVKPEKVYPVTQMTREEMDHVWCTAKGNSSSSIRAVANAALRHAIDANQIITALDHNNALAALDQSLHAAQHVRDMAIAEAVHKAALVNANSYSSGLHVHLLRSIDLATIIAKVRP